MENTIAFIVIVSKFDSPGLLVKIYLQKFIAIINWVKKIVKNKGNCLSIPLIKINIKAEKNEKKIIPISSAKPATAWLKNPIFSCANSSVKTISWMAKYKKNNMLIDKKKFLINILIFKLNSTQIGVLFINKSYNVKYLIRITTIGIKGLIAFLIWCGFPSYVGSIFIVKDKL